MTIEVKVPSVGESILEVTLSSWLKKTGDIVEQDGPICEIESDKATVELVAETQGVLTILVKEGETIPIGTKIAEITPQKGEVQIQTTTPPQRPERPTKPTEPLERTPLKNQSYATGHPSPAAEKILAEKEISPSSLTGSGKDGRITKGDASQASAPPPPEIAPQIPSGAGLNREVERKKMTPLRKTIARRLVEAKNTTAMLTTFNEVDMHEVMALRKKYQEIFINKHQIKLGFMSLFTKALTESLKSFPMVNASIEGDEVLSYPYADVGIAVSTPKGLVVPVLRNAESLTLAQIEKEIVRLATKAKEGKLSLQEMSEGTITVTNGGLFGSMLSTPILNVPQSAILGMHNIISRPVAICGQVVIRPMMYLALSYDHRLIDGKESVGFLKSVKEFIEDPAKMLLGL